MERRGWREGGKECRLYAPVVGAVDGSRAWRIGDTARSSTTGVGVGRAGGVTMATASIAGWLVYLCGRGGGREGGRGGGRCQGGCGVWRPMRCVSGGEKETLLRGEENAEASIVYARFRLSTSEGEPPFVNHKQAHHCVNVRRTKKSKFRVACSS